jgi:hypothetical protein
MTVSTLAPTPEPVLGSGMGAFAETPELAALFATTTAAQRGARQDYWQWLGHVWSAAGCTHPIRLRGALHDVDTETGEILATRSTNDMPDETLYTACGNRRATVCPSCAEVYRADTYQLVIAGLRGGKGVPETVQRHPCVFPTFTAPSFGPVHSRRERGGRALRCRPRRNPEICRHGVQLACNRVHREDEHCLGRPLCLDCYDHDHQVVWNAYAGELWRRTAQTIRRTLDRIAKAHGVQVRLSYAKVAEFQARGVAHFHALMRLDGIDPDNREAVIVPPGCFDLAALEYAIRTAVAHTAFTTPPHPDKPEGWRIAWGEQLDVRPVRVQLDGNITDLAVAAYLAKYATKATEATGHSSRRITPETIDVYARTDTHAGCLVEACWRIGRPLPRDLADTLDNGSEPPYVRLRRWAHMLGFGGHFSTKSRRYSTTLRALREARRLWRRRQHRTAEHAEEETTLIVGALSFAGVGWRTTGDALLANTAAAQAREHRRTAREELHALAA